MEQIRRANNARTYTVRELFQSGYLGPYEEDAMDEIASMRLGFAALINPGWSSSQQRTTIKGRGRFCNPNRYIPPALGFEVVARRYDAWFKRHSQLVIYPSPTFPWGMTVAQLVVNLITEPHGFEYYAPDIGDIRQCGVPTNAVVAMFVQAIQDYADVLEVERRRNNVEQDNIERRARRLGVLMRENNDVRRRREQWKKDSKTYRRRCKSKNKK